MLMFKKILSLAVAMISLVLAPQAAEACTGITLSTTDSARILARTIEWGGSDLNSQYVIVPRGYVRSSFLPGGETDGMRFTARYGYVGLAVEQEEFIAEGLNEAGLSAGLFYFPRYGQYEAYDPERKARTIADLQLVAWLLGECATLDEVREAIAGVHIVQIDPRASTVHWRFADLSGRQLVLEIIDGQAHFHENPLGVLTNSPDFDWQMTNLNNYVNLYPGSAQARQLGENQLVPFGAGSGFLGLPGDVTPPSRFVRAAFYQASAPRFADAERTVLEAFHILNNFDIPIGIEFAESEPVVDLPSATQWTSATNPRDRMLYYRTMHDSAIRRIDLKTIDFSQVSYQAHPLDKEKRTPIVSVSSN